MTSSFERKNNMNLHHPPKIIFELAITSLPISAISQITTKPDPLFLCYDRI